MAPHGAHVHARRADAPHVHYVGCRTTQERQALGQGITVWSPQGDGRWRHLQTLVTTNPSWLVLNERGEFLYALHGDGGTVTAYRILRGGDLEELNTVSSGGTNPVHAVIDHRGRLVIANYASGTVAVLPRDERGALGEPTAILSLRGEPGPDPVGQASSHPHQIVLDPRRRVGYVPDKGLDAIFTIDLDRDTPAVVHAAPTASGTGPRHAILANGGGTDLLYVVGELDSTLSTWVLPDGGPELHRQWCASTLSARAGSSTASGITASADGRFLYVSNRGDDTIACFAVAPSGEPRLIEVVDCLGAYPRFIRFDPSTGSLVVANENSHDVVEFGVDSDSGRLSPGRVLAQTGSPVCVVSRGGRESVR
ncbi:MAG: lactonase family protein [Nocardioides sp.]